jgi:hypothetical protein
MTSYTAIYTSTWQVCFHIAGVVYEACRRLHSRLRQVVKPDGAQTHTVFRMCLANSEWHPRGREHAASRAQQLRAACMCKVDRSQEHFPRLFKGLLLER